MPMENEASLSLKFDANIRVGRKNLIRGAFFNRTAGTLALRPRWMAVGRKNSYPFGPPCRKPYSIRRL
jgi:hypothetical protein